MKPADTTPHADGARRPPRRRLRRRAEPQEPSASPATESAVNQPEAQPLDTVPGSGRGCLSMFALVATILIVGTAVVTSLVLCATLLAYVNYARMLPEGAAIHISALQQSS